MKSANTNIRNSNITLMPSSLILIIIKNTILADSSPVELIIKSPFETFFSLDILSKIIYGVVGLLIVIIS